MTISASLCLMFCLALPTTAASAPLERGVERAVVSLMAGEAREDAYPRRVLLIGASSIEYYVGQALEQRLRAHRGVRVERMGKLSTGLVRHEFFDWPAALEEAMVEKKPDLVIAMLGGNDAQTVADPKRRNHDIGTPGWEVEYARRVKRMIEIANRGGAQMVMVGSPVMRSEGFSEKIKIINRVTEEASREAGATYFSTWELMADADGAYLPTLDWNGSSETPRLSDGIHFSRHGAGYATEKLDWWLQRTFAFIPKSLALAEARRYDLDSQMFGRTVSYLAFVPQGLERHEQLPVLYLLHPQGSDHTAWSARAHEALQRLAARHRLIIVTPDAGPEGWFLDAPGLSAGRAETFVMEELLPHVALHLPTADVRAIAGAAMGGHGALSLALKYPGRFSAASAIDGAVDLAALRQEPALVARLGSYAEAPEKWHRHSSLQLARTHPERAAALPLLLSSHPASRHHAGNLTLHRFLESRQIAHAWDDTLRETGWEAWIRTVPRHIAWHAAQLAPHRAAVLRNAEARVQPAVRGTR